ncbi:DUF185 domain-containing protein [Daldinia decipiens]|uniref:DUF185 domain-containing protein n=1 Tax=Daldinia decipiens TaxID=326647 RepID=UPI0020C460F8|nr:DUF185 domain-containing protein [Daldinia decipiens]KAI1660343.1 DUF185 domain-containing protein [Daldinia decipiens]
MRSNLLRTAQCGLRYLSRRPLLSHGPKVAHQCYRGFAATPATREEKQWSTPLAKHLSEAINTTGPIPLATYMRMCLTGDIDGYYTGAMEAGHDQFGRKGDFVTSPEISQIFGELIGVWFVAEWMSQGRPKQGVELIEIGPGRGTLMDDILRTIRNFKGMTSSIETIYMVEASSELRTVQKNLLCGEDAEMTEYIRGWHSIYKCTSKYNGLRIVWADSLKAIPPESNKTPFIVAHEFFDALPIHAFQLVDLPPTQQPTTPESSNNKTSSPDSAATPKREWREMLVSPTPEGTTHADLGTPQAERHDPVPEFQLTLSSSVTRHAQYLPESSPRYRALKSIPNALFEVCPDSSIYASDFATRIGGSSTTPKSRPSGAALIIDYGPADTIPANSLRGIRQHRRVSPFAAPGQVDLSADVDFGAIVEAATIASPGVECHGPVDQAYFLEAMGVQQRAEMFWRKLEAGLYADNKKKEIESSWRRLVDRGPNGMGKIYKVLTILPENEGRRRPVGFGGDVNP